MEAGLIPKQRKTKMYFVINMDVDTDTKELGHIRHGRILDSVDFARLVKHCEMVDSVAFTSWDAAADYSESFHPTFLTK